MPDTRGVGRQPGIPYCSLSGRDTGEQYEFTSRRAKRCYTVGNRDRILKEQSTFVSALDLVRGVCGGLGDDCDDAEQDQAAAEEGGRDDDERHGREGEAQEEDEPAQRAEIHRRHDEQHARRLHQHHEEEEAKLRKARIVERQSNGVIKARANGTRPEQIHSLWRTQAQVDSCNKETVISEQIHAHVAT